MSSTIEMHVTGLITSRSDVKRGTMIIMVLSMINLTDSTLLKVGATQEEAKSFPIK
jgi:hypothetical protein